MHYSSSTSTYISVWKIHTVTGTTAHQKPCSPCGGVVPGCFSTRQ